MNAAAYHRHSKAFVANIDTRFEGQPVSGAPLVRYPLFSTNNL